MLTDHFVTNVHILIVLMYWKTNLHHRIVLLFE